MRKKFVNLRVIEFADNGLGQEMRHDLIIVLQVFFRWNVIALTETLPSLTSMDPRFSESLR
jgi:hypothetical protein